MTPKTIHELIPKTIQKLLGQAEPEVVETPQPNLEDRLSDDPIRNGVHADQLLNDPLLKQCFENVRLAYLRKFEAIATGDIESLKLIHLSLSALADVRRALLAYRFNGQKAIEKDEKVNGKGNSRNISPNLQRPKPRPYETR